MKSFFKDYLLEILIFIFGLIITIICAVWLSSAETATLSFVITVSTDIILLSYQLGNKSIDEKLATRIRELFLETYMAIQDDMNRVDDRWKDAANRQIEETRERIKNLSTGIREISRPESIEYQANLLKSATSEVLAIHLGDSETALRRWDEKKTTKDFSTVLINANNECKAKVKKRLFIIEGKTDVAYLSSLYTALEVQKKLGFDTRVILKKLSGYPFRSAKGKAGIRDR